MKISVTLLAAVVVVALTATTTLVASTGIVGAESVGGEYVPVLASESARSPTGRLLKRSLCNTFGGCGAKRSLVPHIGGPYRISDEASDERRYEADARMITEILEDILEHLQKDQNYKQGKYVMYVPKQTRAGANLVQRYNPAAAVASQTADEDPSRQHSIQANEFEELRVN